MISMIRRLMNKWLFQFRDAEQGEVYLHQRRVFIIPTKPGLVFGLTLIALFIASVNYNLSLGLGLTFLIAGCAVIDLHLTFRNLAYLYLSPGRTQSVFLGEEAQFELQIINRRKHDRYALWIGFIGEDLPSLEHPIDVRANTTQSVVLTVKSLQRGWLAAPRVRLQTRFPLGLLRAWSHWRPNAKALVYPQPEEYAPPLPIAEMNSENGQGHVGHDDFAGVRAYQAGDSMKQLAWRQIAKLDVDVGANLVSKHFEGGAKSEIDINFAALPRAMDIEMKLSRMTRWVLDAEAQGLNYRFHLGDIAYPSTNGPAHREACLQALALYE
jgi:uncharacterized protein (DUF58 family)